MSETNSFENWYSKGGKNIHSSCFYYMVSILINKSKMIELTHHDSVVLNNNLAIQFGLTSHSKVGGARWMWKKRLLNQSQQRKQNKAKEKEMDRKFRRQGYIKWHHMGKTCTILRMWHLEGGNMAQRASPPPSSTGIPYGQQYMSQLLHFQPALCLQPGKAEEDGSSTWDPAPTWEMWRKLLAPGLDQLNFGHSSHFGSETLSGRLFCLFFL